MISPRRAARTTVPALDPQVRRRAPTTKPHKRAVPAVATPRKGAPMSSSIPSAFTTMKVYKEADWQETPKVVDPKVWELVTYILKAGEAGVVDVSTWSADDHKTFAKNIENVKTHPDFVGGRFYCKRGQLKNGNPALRVTLSFPGRDT